MKRTIRLMTWLAVAAAAPATFAGSPDATKDQGASEEQQVQPTRAEETAAGAADEAGGGRGELPAQMEERNARAADQGKMEKQGKERETIEQYNQRKFLEEIWTRP